MYKRQIQHKPQGLHEFFRFFPDTAVEVDQQPVEIVIDLEIITGRFVKVCSFGAWACAMQSLLAEKGCLDSKLICSHVCAVSYTHLAYQEHVQVCYEKDMARQKLKNEKEIDVYKRQLQDTIDLLEESVERLSEIS